MYCVQKVIWKIENIVSAKGYTFMYCVQKVSRHTISSLNHDEIVYFFSKFPILLRGMDWYKRGIDCIPDKTFGPLTSAHLNNQYHAG